MKSTAVTSGSEAFGSVQAGPFRVSVAEYEPGLRIPSHFHEWACVSVLLEGRFEQRFPGRWCDCPPGVVIAKPGGERHEDRWYDGWSRHLIIEIDPTRHDQLGEARTVAEEIFHVGDLGAETLALAASQELQHQDSATPLAVEGLALQLLARVQRGARLASREANDPKWLATVVEFLREHFADSLRIADVAETVGVHPDHLTRVFQSAYGMSIGEFVRCLRVERAATWLATSDESISVIAYRCGFSDQSHLTRVFRRSKGITPGRFRRLRRG